jgi:DNA polymerase-3 subunit gamma/tau
VLVDELIGEGHSPTHFARQLVRFLRNVTVAKIAGKDSGLLQVSSDERARVSRIAELFSEEDLTRHLQIMLRTHGELGYRQEQRFHLELGLLKMAHAQRLLPLEQLLSDAASASGPVRTTPRPVLALPTEARRTEPSTSARSSSVSPFAADSARKGAPKVESSGGTSATGATSANLVIMGSAAPAVEELLPAPDPQPASIPEARAEAGAEIGTKTRLEPRPAARTQAKTEANAESLRDAVLHALGTQQMLVSLLENAEWRLEGNALIAKVAASSTMIEMSFTADARRIAGAAASGRAGRPIKMLVEPGGAPQAVSATRRSSSKLNGTARSRAEQDPVVQRMQEKFGAEIRTVIDYREKG